MSYKRGDTSTPRGAFWRQNREECTGLRVSVPWCELCSPKTDNTSMAGGRGLLQWYQSHGPDPMCQSATAHDRSPSRHCPLWGYTAHTKAHSPWVQYIPHGFVLRRRLYGL